MTPLSNSASWFHRGECLTVSVRSDFWPCVICSGVLGAKHAISFFKELSFPLLLPWEVETVPPVTYLFRYIFPYILWVLIVLEQLTY